MASYVDRTNQRARSFLRGSLGCSGLAVLCMGGCAMLGLIVLVTSPRQTHPSAVPASAPAQRPAGATPVAPRSPAATSVEPVQGTQAPTAAPPAAPVPVYRVLREAPVEDRQKAQVEGRLLVDPILEPAGIRAVLEHYLEHARARRGWERHEHTTRVSAYAYASEADANGSGAGWIAMLAWRETTSDAAPVITIDPERLEAARHPVERAGLPEPRRREIYRALWEADYESARAGRSEDDANARRIARRFRVSEQQVREIGIEGVQRRW